MPGQTGSAASGCQLDQTPPGRLYFRLLRLRAPTFAYDRVSFSTQVKDMAIEYERITVVPKIGRSAVWFVLAGPFLASPMAVVFMRVSSVVLTG